MAEQQWVYARVASPGEADGEICIFCKQRMVQESQPGFWVLKAAEDVADADFPTADGYAHHACTQQRLAAGRKGSLELPPVPD
jgi:hypothetical protein